MIVTICFHLIKSQTRRDISPTRLVRFFLIPAFSSFVAVNYPRKMKTLNQLLLAFLILNAILVQQTQAQTTEAAKPVYQILGKIFEKDKDEPIPYAAVSLIDATTDKTVAGAVAGFDGEFILANFGDGTYKIQISFMGFQSYSSQPITISATNFRVDLGKIQLETEAVALQEVTVTGQRDLFEEKVDRTIYNAENDKTLIGGDATDVMRRVPMLSVDMDGNVSMRGSSNILVLINGKQSAIVASNVADALKQIPAEEIKSIEVITSPSAKYDAEGTGGVINIVTKKNNLQGATLNINSSAGLRGSNLGLNASLKRGKMGWTFSNSDFK